MPGTNVGTGANVGDGALSTRGGADIGGGGGGATQAQSLAATRAADAGVALGEDAVGRAGERQEAAGADSCCGVEPSIQMQNSLDGDA